MAATSFVYVRFSAVPLAPKAVGTTSNTAHTEATPAAVRPRRLPVSQVARATRRAAPGTSPRRRLRQAHATVHDANRMKPGSTTGTSLRLAHGWSGVIPGRKRNAAMLQL